MFKIAAASNGRAAVAACLIGGQAVPYKYAPSSIGKPENAAEFRSLFHRAACKLVANAQKA